MAKIWITYAWQDNKQKDIDFIAQELGQEGISVKLDRWNIGAGIRLWEQIASFISDPKESDAWLFIATSASLQSEPCKEELAYALNRALDSRDKAFPVIALFLGPVDPTLLPPSISTRLYVSITDPDWKERIRAAAEGRAHAPTRAAVEPYYLKIHTDQPVTIHSKAVGGMPVGGTVTFGQPIAIEVRPRAGVWGPFVAAIPFVEKARVNPEIGAGNCDYPRWGGPKGPHGNEQNSHWWIMGCDDQATPTTSYYIWCDSLPTMLTFGARGGPQYTVYPQRVLS